MLFEKILKFLIGLFLFLLPWQTIWIFRENFLNGKMEWWTLGFYGTEALLWLMVLFFVCWFWNKRKLYRNYTEIIQKFSFSKDRIFVLSVLSLISYLSLSFFGSIDKPLALQQSLRIMEAFLLFFVLWLGPLKKEGAIKWLVLGSILPCILGIWQFLTQSTFASTWLGLALHPAWQSGTSVVASDTIGRWLRAYGTFSHPNVLGGYIVIVLLLYCLPVRSHDVAKAGSVVENEKGWVQLITYNLLLTTLFFTFSRSAWLAAIVSFSVIQFFSLRNRKNISYLLSLISIIIILVALFFPLVQTRLTGDSVSEVRSTDERVSEYGDAWKLLKKDPILGVGAGNYTVALRHSDKWRPAWEIQPVHNAFVLFVVEGGLVGVGLFLLAFVSYILYLTSYILHQKNKLHVICYPDKVRDPVFHRDTLQVTSFLFLASFDHYLYSSYIGLMLSALFFGLISQKDDGVCGNPQLI